MVIQHNISALNAHRQMGVNNSSTSKNLEKLSSGYKINRAGDDAAGLAISEKMRGQIRGLAMAEQNASNGISLIQTAEGGLNETHAILQRMRELAVQSANGTYKDEVDRENLNKEVDALKEEIDRIATSTHYNGINLLDGSLSSGGGTSSVKYEVGSVIKDAAAQISSTAQKSSLVVAAGDVGALAQNGYASMRVRFVDAEGTLKDISVSFQHTAAGPDKDTLAAGLATALQQELGSSYVVDGSTTAGTISISSAEKGSNSFEILKTEIGVGATKDAAIAASKATANSATNVKGIDETYGIDFAGVTSTNLAAATANAKFELDGQKFQIVQLGKEAEEGYTAIYTNTGYVAGAADVAVISDQLNQLGFETTNVTPGTTTASTNLYVKKAAADVTSSAKGLTFQIGANGSKDQRVSLRVDNMDSASIGVKGVSVGTQEDAKNAIEVIDTAINTVSGTRADLGALQNRLEHTLNNLGVTKENLTAAESSIRDVDMAKEMMEFTKNNILVQASQAMLAQANQLPQGVLSLLR